MNHSRREFLKTGAALVFAGGTLLTSDWAYGAQAQTLTDWKSSLLMRPRAISLRHLSTGERLLARDAQYWSPQGGFDVAAYRRICWFFRDRAAKNETAQVSIYLLNMIVGMQNWMAFYGYEPTLVYHSGYRNPLRNARIEGAARNSWHTVAAALDYHHPNLTISQLNEMAKMWQGGGVGFYPGKRFIHIDPGRIRNWRG